MTINPETRRSALRLAAATMVGPAALAIASCGDQADAKEVGAVEDLMREHGVLRRVLLVYAVSVSKLRTDQRIDAKALNRAAKLFHDFGEEYHERKLEESFI